MNTAETDKWPVVELFETWSKKLACSVDKITFSLDNYPAVLIISHNCLTYEPLNKFTILLIKYLLLHSYSTLYFLHKTIINYDVHPQTALLLYRIAETSMCL